jgi:hypothetical protein
MKNRSFRNIFSGFLLAFILLGLNPAWAAPNSSSNEQGSLFNAMKVGVDFGLGLPLLYAIPDGVKKEMNKNGTSIAKNLNFSLGVTLGYDFLVAKNSKIGPEIGLLYGFPRALSFERNGAKLSIEETYLQIPIGLKWCAFDDEGFYTAYGLSLGYEFRALLSSRYTQEGNSAGLPPALVGNKEELDKVIKDLATTSGSIYLGSTIDLPKGFYIVTKLKVPMELFDLDSLKNGKPDELDSPRVTAIRLFSSSLIEFNLGLDIMKLFVPAS